MAEHPVTDGDCLSSIAAEKQFRSYRSIWDHADNKALRDKRPNPNMLLAGDVVQLPLAKGKIEKRPTGQTHSFVVKVKKPVKLRVILVDGQEKPLAGRDWQLTAPKAESGKTKEDGLIETEIPPDAKSGTLKVTKIFEAPVIPPDPPAAAAADPSLVVYPRSIAPGEFKDAAPPDPATLENDVEWTLKIGSLPCPKEDAGVIARLENLGYSCGSETSPGPKTAAAVKAYERKHEVEPLTGSVASVRDAIARLLLLRCILQELAWSAQIPDLAHLIRREDIRRAPQRLPRALTPQQDQLIQQELLRCNDLPSNALLLMRHTGMRIGECVDLAHDCLHSAGPVGGRSTFLLAS